MFVLNFISNKTMHEMDWEKGGWKTLGVLRKYLFRFMTTFPIKDCTIEKEKEWDGYVER